MSVRLHRRTVTFPHPFRLSSLDGAQPAGVYTVETEEELIESLSFPVYRRLSTVILIPGPPGSMILYQAAPIDPDELADAEGHDTGTG